MQLENKFLFIGKVFLVIFIIINAVNLFPRYFQCFLLYSIFQCFIRHFHIIITRVSHTRFLYVRKINTLNKIKNNNVKKLEILILK